MSHRGKPPKSAHTVVKSEGKASPVDSAAPGTPLSDPEGDEITIITQDGDLVLQIEHENGERKTACKLRVSAKKLASASKYFARLVEPGRFGEGERVEAELKDLKTRYPSITDAPAIELPSIVVQDLGRISNVKSISPLCTDLMNVLHGNDIPAVLPVANLANIAIVADRFDALGAVGDYAQRKKLIRTIDGKTAPKTDSSLPEEKVRQRLLVAILLNYPPWVEKYSARLVTKGWVGNEIDDSTALWWDLPSRIEEELACRRDYLLDTIQSVQAHFLALYSSRTRQCKLGYDSSGPCDSFQLGEMVRFFMKIGTLQLQGVVYDANEPLAPYAGDIYVLLDAIQQVPEPQIDSNHHHCGLRTRIVPLLEILRESIPHLGISFEPWKDNWAQYAWMEAKQPLLWKRQEFRIRHQSRDALQTNLRTLFMASERDWTS